jgi:hypothetical protein
MIDTRLIPLEPAVASVDRKTTTKAFSCIDQWQQHSLKDSQDIIVQIPKWLVTAADGKIRGK